MQINILDPALLREAQEKPAGLPASDGAYHRVQRVFHQHRPGNSKTKSSPGSATAISSGSLMTEPKKELTGAGARNPAHVHGRRTRYPDHLLLQGLARCTAPGATTRKAYRPGLRSSGWESRCIGCLTCVKVCPEKALTATDHGIAIDRDLCTGCGTCAEECPSTAMELLGREWDRARPGGGSGQGQRVFPAVRRRDHGFRRRSTIAGRIRGRLSGRMPWPGACPRPWIPAGMSPAAPWTWPCPRPTWSCSISRSWTRSPTRSSTGQDNKLILENLEYVRERIKGPGRPHRLWIRTPIIPRSHGHGREHPGRGPVHRPQPGRSRRNAGNSAPFNNLCRDKYKRLGLDWAYKDSPLMTADRMEELTAAARTSGVDPDLPVWTGATRLEKIEADNDADTRSAGAPACC